MYKCTCILLYYRKCGNTARFIRRSCSPNAEVCY